MSYTKTNWVDGVTPLSANNFNKMEQGIYDASEKLENFNNKTHVVITTSQTYTLPDDVTTFDLFLVGGGGGASGNYGAGGGYTTTQKNIAVSGMRDLNIVIGAGGTYDWSNPTDGGNTTVTHNSIAYTSNGGKSSSDKGADGGSGGGGSYGGNGGSDGSNGFCTLNGYDGQGQGTTTRAFEELLYPLFAGGGGASKSSNTIGYGGEGGGGSYKRSGIPNTGGGGGAEGGNGGSGVVIIRY